MRNTNQIRTNGTDLGFRQDRQFDAVRCAGNPRFAEVLSRGSKSTRRVSERSNPQQNPLALDRLQVVVVGKPAMGEVLMGLSIMGQPILGKRRIATCPAAKRPKYTVAKRLTGTYRETTMHWHLVSDRGEPVRPVVHSTLRVS